MEKGINCKQRICAVKQGKQISTLELTVKQCGDKKLSNYEVIEETESLCQIHYVIDLTVGDRKNADLEGIFHITSTWKKYEDKWKLIFNMDSRIIKS